MLKNTLLCTLFFFVTQAGNAQDSMSVSIPTGIRNIEVKTGGVISFIPNNVFNRFPLNVNVVYIHGITNHLSFVSYSDFYSNRRKDRDLDDLTYRHWLESIGIGGSYGIGIITQNIFLMAGSKLYYSKLNVDDDELKASLVTKRWKPDVGILYNVSISKRRLYFCCQLYLSILPIKNFLENKQPISFGVGYKLCNNKK
jgi:hypothetical protein